MNKKPLIASFVVTAFVVSAMLTALPLLSKQQRDKVEAELVQAELIQAEKRLTACEKSIGDTEEIIALFSDILDASSRGVRAMADSDLNGLVAATEDVEDLTPPMEDAITSFEENSATCNPDRAKG